MHIKAFAVKNQYELFKSSVANATLDKDPGNLKESLPLSPLTSLQSDSIY